MNLLRLYNFIRFINVRSVRVNINCVNANCEFNLYIECLLYLCIEEFIMSIIEK